MLIVIVVKLKYYQVRFKLIAELIVCLTIESLRRGALGAIRNRKTAQKITQNRKTEIYFDQNRKPNSYKTI